MRPELNGKWTVKLVYGEHFGPLAHEQLFFTMDIRQAGEEFTGNSQDIDGIGINPYQAKVNGFIENNNLNFVREYEAAGNSQGEEFSFSGSYNAETSMFEGEWIVVAAYTVYSNVFFEDYKSGTWSMTRD